jgi:hypothetical protein
LDVIAWKEGTYFKLFKRKTWTPDQDLGDSQDYDFSMTTTSAMFGHSYEKGIH